MPDDSDDQELRKYCVGQTMNYSGNTSSPNYASATALFNYIKEGTIPVNA